MTLVIVAVTDLMFQPKIIEVAQSLNGDIVLASSQEAVLSVLEQLKPARLLIDLNEKKFDAIETIKLVKQKYKLEIVGFVSHVQRDIQARATLVGCDKVLARSAFVKELPQLLA
mgnify:CR=1 FL=1